MPRSHIDRLIHDLAVHVVGERVDAFLLVPTLVTSLKVEVNDFQRYYGDASLAPANVRDHHILLAYHAWKRDRDAKV